LNKIQDTTIKILRALINFRDKKEYFLRNINSLLLFKIYFGQTIYFSGSETSNVKELNTYADYNACMNFG